MSRALAVILIIFGIGFFIAGISGGDMTGFIGIPIIIIGGIIIKLDKMHDLLIEIKKKVNNEEEKVEIEEIKEVL